MFIVSTEINILLTVIYTLCCPPPQKEKIQNFAILVLKSNNKVQGQGCCKKNVTLFK